MVECCSLKDLLILVVFLEVSVVPIECGRYDWLMYINDYRNVECFLYGPRYFCHSPEFDIEIEKTVSQSKCRNGSSFSFGTLKRQNVSVEILIDWFIPFHLIEQYADYLSRSNADAMGDTLICNCSINYVGTNCNYKLVRRTQDAENFIKSQRGAKFSHYETITSLIDQMPCRNTYPQIEWRQICDGIIHCENALDEIDCDKLEFHQCAQDEFQCRNGMCIPKAFLFDGQLDCLDHSDEQDIAEFQEQFDKCFESSQHLCDEHLCAKNQISCGDGQCVHWSALFNRAAGCRNQRHQAFRCDMMNAYSLIEHKLNGICQQTTLPIENLTDESNCWVSLRHFLSVDRLQNVSATIHMSMNNIVRHCPDRIRYPNHSILFPGLSSFYNRTQLEIIFNTTNQSMKNISFQPHIYCFNRTIVCKYFSVTSAEHEEEECFNTDVFEDMILRFPFFSLSEILCHVIREPSVESSYQCQNSTFAIASRRLNDGYIDCLYGDDEYNDLGIADFSQRYRCETVSKPEQYISVNLLGNGKYDCRDGSDEMSSSVNWLLLQCISFDYYACWIFQGDFDRLSSVELPYHRYCDTHWDTINGTDEKDCSSWTCNIDEYQCQRTGQCIDRKYYCDGEWDCSDGEDELRNCSIKSQKWSYESYICNATIELYCVTEDFLINRTLERPCISKMKIGDGQIDCIGGRDERNLFMCNDRQLLGDRFVCDNQTRCLHYSSLCNGISDCLDQTDEQICFWNRSNCSAGQYACHRGKTSCVANRCNSKLACTDGSHWYWCPNTFLPSDGIYRKNKQVDAILFRQKFCSKLKPNLRITHVPSSIHLPLALNNTGYCNRGYYLINENESKLICFCPPSYYGSRCQYDQRRVDVLIRFDRWYRTDIPAILNVLVALIHNNSRIVDHQYAYDIADSNENSRKFQIYLLYPRPKPNGTFSVRVEAYTSTQLLGLWEYPISPLDFLPVFLLAKNLRFSSNVPPDKCLINPCLNQGNCFITQNNRTQVCFCSRGWEGEHCEVKANHTKCAPHALVRSDHVCICPSGYLFPHCYVQDRKYETNSVCQFNGTRELSSHQPPDMRFCICNRQQCPRHTVLLSLSRKTSISVPWVLELLKITSDYLTVGQRILIGPSTNWSTMDHLKMYDMNSRFEIVSEIGLLLTFERFQYRVDVFISLIYTKCSSGSPNLTFNLDDPLNQCRRLDGNKSFSIKNLSNICEHVTDESCFLWKKNLCICQSSNKIKPNCISYDERRITCSHCYNQGYCLQVDLRNIDDFVCVCPRCASGDLCQDAPGKFSISLEYLFAKTRWGRYHLILPTVFLIGGIILNNLCLMTFSHRQSRQTGPGIYLLVISILNQMIFINLFLCVLYLHLLEQTIFNESLNRLLCKSLPYSMNCLYFTTIWLMAFITIDRAVAANFISSCRFSKKTRIAYGLSIFTGIMVFITMYPQIKLYKLIIHPTYKYHSCIREIEIKGDQYTHYMQLVHQTCPFAINLIAALLIILAISRSKARVHHLSARFAFQKQIGQRKDLLIGPLICFITEVPKVVLAFLDSCNYQSNIWFSHFFLIAYYISFVPQLAVFLIYLLPSPLYKHLLMKETIVGKRVLSRI